MKEYRTIKSYVIRGGRLGEGRKRALAELYGIYGLPFVGEHIDLASLFPPERAFNRVIAEIGFGTGEVTAAVAEDNPETFFIGIEVFPAGVGNLLKIIHECGLQNLRVIRHDAAEVICTMLPDSCLDGFHIFFPDPWPKKKHHKRRLLNDGFIALMRDKLKTGGYLYAVTDWEDYAEQILTSFNKTPGLKMTGAKAGETGFSLRQQWRPQTKFEKKGLEKNHLIREIHFTKA